MGRGLARLTGLWQDGIQDNAMRCHGVVVQERMQLGHAPCKRASRSALPESGGQAGTCNELWGEEQCEQGAGGYVGCRSAPCHGPQLHVLLTR